MNPLAPFKLEREFAQHEFSVRLMASSSDAESLSVGDLLKLAGKTTNALDSVWLGYSDSAGIPPLREAIARTYESIGAADILCHLGAQEPIYNFFHACLEPGDHVVVHFPCYQSFHSVPRSRDIDVTFWEAQLEGDWLPSITDLEKSLRPNTRAVFVNFPHNPTGAVAPRDYWDQVIALLKPRGIILFSDEVYRGLEFDLHSAPLPAACDLYENAVTLGVLSKSYGLAGLRLGWIATHRADIIAKLAGQKDYTTICNPILSETLAVMAIENRAKIFDRNLRIVRDNWARLEKVLQKHRGEIEWRAPRGGTMLFPRFKNKDARWLAEFYRCMREERGVFVVRGDNFDCDDRYFRLGIGRANFPEVLVALDAEWEKTLG